MPNNKKKHVDEDVGNSDGPQKSKRRRPLAQLTTNQGVVDGDDDPTKGFNDVDDMLLMDDDLDDCFANVDLQELIMSGMSKPTNNESNNMHENEVSPLCKCDAPSVLKTSDSESNPNRMYYTCAKKKDDEEVNDHACNFFIWKNEVTTILTIQGPNCLCGQPTIQRPRDGSLVWVCSNPDKSTACSFDQDCSVPNSLPLEQHPSSTGSVHCLRGDVEFIVPGAVRSKLQTLFNVPHHTFKAPLKYDNLCVEVAWKVVNNQNLQTYLGQDRTDYKKKKHAAIRFRKEYNTAVTELLKQRPLDHETNEVILLHATAPWNVYPILFEGLDISTARRDGPFGRGLYFSDEGAKVNQYAGWMDKEDSGNNSKHTLYNLHKKLYSSELVQHPGDVCYAFVCRVALGNNLPVDNKDDIPFTDRSESALKTESRYQSVLAKRTKTKERPHREFVIFNSGDVQIEYLIAYKRKKYYCNCGVEANVRDVCVRTANHGRKFLFCGNKTTDEEVTTVQSTKTCDMTLMLPLCDCKRLSSAFVWKRNDEMTRFACGKNYSRCKFKEERKSVSTGRDLWVEYVLSRN